MIIVIQGGLSAAEIMERTSSNILVALFYGLFVVAAAMHGSIGLRTVAQEVLNWKGPSLDLVLFIFFALLCVLGVIAIIGLVL
jgi:fumarate reductase subunit C